MALDFSSDVNQSFLEDNFLSSEDWDFQNDFADKDVPSDVTSLESFGITLNYHPYGTAHDELSSDSSTKSWNGMDDDFISTVDADVKGEPSSPQLSQCSTDSHSSQHLQNDQYHVKLESPPLTPPHEVCPVVSTHLNGITQDNQSQMNLLNGSKQLPTTQSQSDYVLQNTHSVSNKLQVVSGNMSKGSQVANDNINLATTSSGVLVRNGKCMPKVVMTTSGLPNGIKVQVVNNGTKRLANGTIKSGGRINTKKGTVPKRNANGVTIHPPIIPKMEGIHVNGVPATIAVTQMTAAAKAIMFSQNGNTGCDLTASCQGTVPLQQTVTVSAAQQRLSPGAPEDITDEKEMMAWKRQQRMIRNRESASLSRKKKKEYVQTLELKMQNITMENDMLKDENMSLKKRLCALEEEVERLKCLSSTSPSSPMSGKYVTCLLAVILFIGINLTPFSLLNTNTKNDDFIVTSHHSRSLLSFEDFQNGSDVQSPPALMADIIKDQYYNETLLRLHDESSQHLLRLAELEQALLMQQPHNCSYLHKRPESALSARLLDVLRKQTPDKEQTNEDNRNHKKEESTHSKKLKKLRKVRRKKMKIQEAKWSQMESEERSLQIYDSFFIRHYENLINSLERRDDTYYIVSLTRDHLLLPAMSHNSTQRPKMSLVMPAGGNATMWDTPKDHLTMMQIDCEVTNTRTISVPDFRNAVTQNGTKTATPPRHTPKEAATSNHSSPPSAASQSTSGHFKAIPPPHRKSLPPHIKKFRAGKKYSVKSNVTKT